MWFVTIAMHVYRYNFFSLSTHPLSWSCIMMKKEDVERTAPFDFNIYVMNCNKLKPLPPPECTIVGSHGLGNDFSFFVPFLIPFMPQQIFLCPMCRRWYFGWGGGGGVLKRSSSKEGEDTKDQGSHLAELVRIESASS